MKFTYHIINMVYAARRAHFLVPHFITFPLFAFPSAGALDKLVLPVGMNEVIFAGCEGLTGMTEGPLPKIS